MLHCLQANQRFTKTRLSKSSETSFTLKWHGSCTFGYLSDSLVFLNWQSFDGGRFCADFLFQVNFQLLRVILRDHMASEEEKAAKHQSCLWCSAGLWAKFLGVDVPLKIRESFAAFFRVGSTWRLFEAGRCSCSKSMLRSQTLRFLGSDPFFPHFCCGFFSQLRSLPGPRPEATTSTRRPRRATSRPCGTSSVWRRKASTRRASVVAASKNGWISCSGWCCGRWVEGARRRSKILEFGAKRI